MKEFKTAGGKTIILEVAQNTVLYKLRFAEGGELPEELSGLYTNDIQAEKAVVLYLDKVKPKKAA